MQKPASYYDHDEADETTAKPAEPWSKQSLVIATIVCLVAGIVYAKITLSPQARHPFDTPLHQACYNGNLTLATKLVLSGANVNAQGPANVGDTPLMLAIAADSNSVAIARLLLEHGANPRLADKTGRTALHVAALYDADTIAAMLIAHDADVNARDIEGHTPLSYIGPWLKDKPTKRVLLENGAR